MAFKRLSNLRMQYLDSTGLLASGYRLFFYAAGSSTKQPTYNSSTGAVANSNPITLNALGEPPVEIWLTTGLTYKVQLAPPGSDDPPASPVWAEDVIGGINDASITLDQWVASGISPAYVSATQFTLPGDQTSTFQVGRRVKATITAGTVYGRISVSAFAAMTTITVVLDSGALDSGLSAVSYGLLSVTNPSVPAIIDAGSGITITYPAGRPTVAATTTFNAPDVQDFRLTLTSGTPVTTADVTAATTIYCSPYKGNQISLYDGASWNVRLSAEFSIALGTLTSALPYDVFCYDNAGTPTLELLAWTNATTRATALVYQNGILSKTGALTRRYLGTFYTTSTTTTEDSLLKRFLWNYTNRVQRRVRVTDTTSSWTYATATFRQANGAAANQVDTVIGWTDTTLNLRVVSTASNSGSFRSVVGIGVGSATVNSAQIGSINNVTVLTPLSAEYMANPAVGRQFYAWLEYAGGATTTFLGSDSSGANASQSGMLGTVDG